MHCIAKVNRCEPCAELRKDRETSLNAGASRLRRTNDGEAGERNDNRRGRDRYNLVGSCASERALAAGYEMVGRGRILETQGRR